MQLGEQVQRLSEALLGISGVMTCHNQESGHTVEIIARPV